MLKIKIEIKLILFGGSCYYPVGATIGAQQNPELCGYIAQCHTKQKHTHTPEIFYRLCCVRVYGMCNIEKLKTEIKLRQQLSNA